MQIAPDILFFRSIDDAVSAVLYVVTGVGVFEWPISTRALLIYVTFWKLSNNPPNYASVADAMKLLIILYSTCTGPFYGGTA